jgi:bifunctional DNA-binding transcriptional regulator/antitoxin component of YhaV-PrlF toxin-antitoxin module
MEITIMPQVKLREKGQVTIPAELLQEWSKKNHVSVNDSMEARLANGVLMLIPKKRHAAKRTVMSFAGVGKGLWGSTPDEVNASIKAMRDSWTR